MTDPDGLDQDAFQSSEEDWPSILLDAFTLVHGDRGEMYGPPHLDYERTVAIFNAITGRDLSIAEGFLFMKAVKLSRIQHGLEAGLPPEKIKDSLVDDAGYGDCLWGYLSTIHGETP